MKISILKERFIGENRVAITPEVVKKFVAQDISICIEKGAGENSSISDEEFSKAGAKISNIPLEILSDADIVLKVRPAENKDFNELEFMKEGSIIIGQMFPYENKELFLKYCRKKITSFATEFIPRITRAQTMDVLSSQSNLAGYKAVIIAANTMARAMPMMMTAAGTIAPAKVLILGAGVAGLQAVATARRLGAIVSAFDVRSAAKEQVESLGANFIEVKSEENLETQGGYAKEASEDYKRKQSELIANTIKNQDIVISTALIPGKKAPILITSDMVKNMKPGSVIVDLAAAGGGNCELTEVNKIINYGHVKIVGYDNIPSMISEDASKLYAKNLYNFIQLLVSKEGFKIDFEDEIIKSSIITYNGEIINSNIK